MLKTVASFTDPVEAQIVCALLQSAGLGATTTDLNLATANRLWTYAIGGVRVQVAEADFEEAKALVADYHAGNLAEDDTPVCQACGGADFALSVPASEVAIAVAVFALTSAPINTHARRKCKACGTVQESA